MIAQRFSPSWAGDLVPQPTYRPHTQSDRRRYVEQVDLEAPILFFSRDTMGIPLADAISSRFMHLQGRDDPMFKERGPSVSIRLNVSTSCLSLMSMLSDCGGLDLLFLFNPTTMLCDSVAGLRSLVSPDPHQGLP